MSRRYENMSAKKLARSVGRAVSDFAMIHENDKVAVGLSGGKDSAFLLHSLCALRDRSPVRFTLEALTVDPTGGARDVTSLARFAESYGVRHHVAEYPIFDIVEKSGTPSPCSFCANIRRGILASNASSLGCGTLALGHHRDDAVETVFLNLMYEGRFRSFRPSMFMSRSGVRVIRPLVYIPESDIKKEAERLKFPLVNFCCGYEASSMRTYVKVTLRRLSRHAPMLQSSVLHALRNVKADDVWDDCGN